MENFKLLKIEDTLKNSLHKMNFVKPTPIQSMAISMTGMKMKIRTVKNIGLLKIK